MGSDGSDPTRVARFVVDTRGPMAVRGPASRGLDTRLNPRTDRRAGAVGPALLVLCIARRATIDWPAGRRRILSRLDDEGCSAQADSDKRAGPAKNASHGQQGRHRFISLNDLSTSKPSRQNREEHDCASVLHADGKLFRTIPVRVDHRHARYRWTANLTDQRYGIIRTDANHVQDLIRRSVSRHYDRPIATGLGRASRRGTRLAHRGHAGEKNANDAAEAAVPVHCECLRSVCGTATILQYLRALRADLFKKYLSTNNSLIIMIQLHTVQSSAHLPSMPAAYCVVCSQPMGGLVVCPECGQPCPGQLLVTDGQAVLAGLSRVTLAMQLCLGWSSLLGLAAFLAVALDLGSMLRGAAVAVMALFLFAIGAMVIATACLLIRGMSAVTRRSCIQPSALIIVWASAAALGPLCLFATLQALRAYGPAANPHSYALLLSVAGRYAFVTTTGLAMCLVLWLAFVVTAIDRYQFVGRVVGHPSQKSPFVLLRPEIVLVVVVLAAWTLLLPLPLAALSQIAIRIVLFGSLVLLVVVWSRVGSKLRGIANSPLLTSLPFLCRGASACPTNSPPSPVPNPAPSTTPPPPNWASPPSS